MGNRVLILFGTETGNAEYCAERLADAVDAMGQESVLVDMGDYAATDLPNESLVFIVTSTHGQGDAPGNAMKLLDSLKKNEIDLTGVRYAVCGLGDTSFTYFAQCGKDFDAILEKRGATRVINRVDCDEDYDPEFAEFNDQVVAYLEDEDARRQALASGAVSSTATA